MNELVKKNKFDDIENELMKFGFDDIDKDINISKKDFSRKYTRTDDNDKEYTVEETASFVEINISNNNSRRYEIKENTKEVDFDEYGSFKGIKRKDRNKIIDVNGW